MPYTISPARSLICRFFHPPVTARAVGAMMQRAAAGRVRRRADGSWSSIHLGNAPKPRRRHPPFGATFTGGGLLVGSDESGVEHQVLVVRIADELRKNPLPERSPLPSA